jgi:hypothetical protein
MILHYFLIALLVLAIEYCDGINTKFILDKIAHGILFLGCITASSTGHQDIFMLGVILTLGVAMKNGCQSRNRRCTDKEAKQ